MKKILVMSEFRNESDVLVKEKVGELIFENESWVFSYAETWLNNDDEMDLDHNLPLQQESFVSPKLWRVFTERLPGRGGPTFTDYCTRWGVDPNSQDYFELLPTVGHRGPDTFVLYPVGYNPGKWSEVTKPRPE